VLCAFWAYLRSTTFRLAESKTNSQQVVLIAHLTAVEKQAVSSGLEQVVGEPSDAGLPRLSSPRRQQDT
jgi:hypothetical protein